MNVLQRCLRYLKQNGIHYSHSIHPAAYTARTVASAECIPAHELEKVVVYFGERGYGMLVLPADYMIDLHETARVLGQSMIRLATESELVRLFRDCEVGAMPPFGKFFDMPVLMDDTVGNAKFMAFNAGTHRDVIRITVSDFRKLVSPLVVAFASKGHAETVS